MFSFLISDDADGQWVGKPKHNSLLNVLNMSPVHCAETLNMSDTQPFFADSFQTQVITALFIFGLEKHLSGFTELCDADRATRQNKKRSTLQTCPQCSELGRVLQHSFCFITCCNWMRHKNASAVISLTLFSFHKVDCFNQLNIETSLGNACFICYMIMELLLFFNINV